MVLSLTTRRSVVTLITRFVTETAAWQWDDVPARVLFTRADIPSTDRCLGSSPITNSPRS
jgi:hypothetical protein